MSRVLAAASGAERPSDVSRRIGDAQGAFDAIRETYAYQDDAVGALHAFMLSHANCAPGTPCGGASLVAAYGTGKTEAIEKLKAQVAPDFRPGTVPVLRAEIPTSGSIDHVPNAILEALGVPRPDAGRPAFRWQKAVAKMREAEVRLLTVDEFDRAARRPTMSQPIANVLREKIMDAGIAPIAFAGTKPAGELLESCDALFDRLLVQIPLDPLDWISMDDREVSGEFLAAIDARLVGDRILRNGSGLADRAETIVKASGGRIRQIMKILRAGLGAAAARNGASISLADLASGWAELPRKSGVAANPFAGTAA